MLVRMLCRFDRARLGFRGTKYERCDARVHHRADAHEARLDRDVQRRTRETVVSHVLTRGTHRQKLGVGRRVVRLDRLVVRAPDDLVAEYDYGADWDFAAFGRPRGLAERFAHESLVQIRLTS
jgi:hypothetical protein